MYIESFNKNSYPKSVLYCIIFLLWNLFGGKILSLIPVNFIYNNLTFWAYLFLFTMSMLFFAKSMLFTSLKKFDKKYLPTFAVIGIITFFAVVFSGIAIDVLDIPNPNENDINTALQSSHLNYILTAVSAIIFAPIAEELFFRFVLYRSIEKINPILAHLCAAVFFGFFHFWDYILIKQDYIQLVSMIPYISMSLGFSILYQKTKNIWNPIFLHSLINFIAVTI